MLPRPSGIVTLLTDFGLRDPYVGAMKGSVLKAHPKATIVDLGHDVPAQDVEGGAFAWLAAVGHFPPGTVHVGVVDPGVGTARKLLAAAAHEAYWLAPDNGLLTHVLAAAPEADVRELDVEHLGVRPASRTFHGRDVLAPAAGWLAGARYGFSALGPRAPDPVRLDALDSGPPRVVHVDGYGTLITNVCAAALDGVAAVRVAGAEAPLRGTYDDVPANMLVALVGSFGLLEIAVNRGDAALRLGVRRGAPVELVASPGDARA